MFTKGQIVFSKCGRDRGRPFVIFGMDSEYVYLVDGDMRTLDNPKKKKIKHVQITHHIDESLNCKLEQNLYLNNTDITRALCKYS